jgi:uncharacterized protein YciI
MTTKFENSEREAHKKCISWNSGSDTFLVIGPNGELYEENMAENDDEPAADAKENNYPAEEMKPSHCDVVYIPSEVMSSMDITFPSSENDEPHREGNPCHSLASLFHGILCCS